MEHITKETRLEKYRSSPEAIKGLYASEKLGDQMATLSQKYAPDKITLLVNCFGDTILGFYTTSELPNLLQKKLDVSAEDALRIVSDLTEYLSPVLEREKLQTNPKAPELKDLEEIFDPKILSKKPEETIPSEVTEHSEVQSMRTMEGDMSRVHGYGAYRNQFPDEANASEHTEETIRKASQEEILKEKPQLAEKPSYGSEA